jgi:Right handed beta helix region
MVTHHSTNARPCKRTAPIRTSKPRVAALLTLALATTLPPAAARAQVARCGMVVGEQVVLDRDLSCDGVGLVIRNPRTVVQLNGHTLATSSRCDTAATPPGIAVESTAEGAQILGPGLVRGFTTGVEVAGAARVRVQDVRVSDSCQQALRVVGAEDVQAVGLTLHRNGRQKGDDAATVLAQGSPGFDLEGSEIVRNGAGVQVATVELRDCDACRLAGNHVLANHGPGLRLDVESQSSYVERNTFLDNRGADVVDQGSDNTFVLNLFERGDGVARTPLWPLTVTATSVAPGVAGCAIVYGTVRGGGTVTVTCPQDPGLRGLRNSVVGYRLMNVLQPMIPIGSTCDPVQIQSASSSSGGAVQCTFPQRIGAAVVEVTCCLN